MACYPWLKAGGSQLQLKLDSCGIFIVGGASSVSLWHGPNVYEKLTPLVSGIVAPILEDADEREDAPAEAPAQDNKAFDVLQNGPGFELTCYLPKGNQQASLRTTLTASVEADGAKDWEPLPTTREKMCGASIFDRSDTLLRAGAHMPLMVFLWQRSRRSPEALLKREEKYLKSIQATQRWK